MSRKTDLEQHIRESYQLIREYEEIQRLSDDPKEQARSRRAIEEQRVLIKGYLAEYVPLCERLGLTMPEDIAEMVARFPRIASPSFLPPGPSVRPSSPPPLEGKQLPWARMVRPKWRLIEGWLVEVRQILRDPLWQGCLFSILLALDFVLALYLGWRWFGQRPDVLAYVEAVSGVISLALQVVFVFIALVVRKMSLRELLHQLGTQRLLQVAIGVMTMVLVVVAVILPAVEGIGDSRPPPTPPPHAIESFTVTRAESIPKVIEIQRGGSFTVRTGEIATVEVHISPAYAERHLSFDWRPCVPGEERTGLTFVYNGLSQSGSDCINVEVSDNDTGKQLDQTHIQVGIQKRPN